MALCTRASETAAASECHGSEPEPEPESGTALAATAPACRPLPRRASQLRALSQPLHLQVSVPRRLRVGPERGLPRPWDASGRPGARPGPWPEARGPNQRRRGLRIIRKLPRRGARFAGAKSNLPLLTPMGVSVFSLWNEERHSIIQRLRRFSGRARTHSIRRLRAGRAQSCAWIVVGLSRRIFANRSSPSAFRHSRKWDSAVQCT